MAPDLAALLSQTLEMLRYYRSRSHRPAEDDEGTQSLYHTVYGVHRSAMNKADDILWRSREWGLLRPADQVEEFHG